MLKNVVGLHVGQGLTVSENHRKSELAVLRPEEASFSEKDGKWHSTCSAFLLTVRRVSSRSLLNQIACNFLTQVWVPQTLISSSNLP